MHRMNPVPEILDPRYDLALVLASFAVSALGSYCALAAATLMRRGRQGVDRLNAALAGLALGGVGIWSMHFLGMLAWDTGIAVGYRPLETAVSFVVAVVASALALGAMAAGPFSYRRLAVAGPLAGLGVSAMHFIGMGSMRFGGFLDWHFTAVALAVGIAIAAATAALWLAFHVRRGWHRIAAALVMALAVCTMHYTGMAAADVVCTSADRFARLPGLLYGSDLQAVVIVAAVSIAALVGFDALFQWVTRQQQAGAAATR
jgi:NO-binding membrane sensor protein with MHYT domain